MIKYVALLFNTVALLIYQFFFADGITITQKAPANVKPGSEFTVELTIKKGDADGFAKLQQELPDGFEATGGATSGASFAFTNNSVKFIWMALPNDKEFKVSYKVKVDASIITGEKFIAGKFAYVVNNVKQQVEISPVTITIDGNSAPVANNTPPTPPKQVNTSSQDNLISVSGNYLDDKDAPINNLKVLLRNVQGEILQTTSTDSTGFFAFSKLAHDADCIVGLEELDTHIVGRKSKAQYKDSKGTVIVTKDLNGNTPVAANTVPSTTELTTTATEVPPVTNTTPPANTTTEPPVAYQPPAATTETQAPPTNTNETKATESNTNKAVETPIANTAAQPSSSTGPESSSVVCSRVVPESVSESSFNVEITINKGNIGGFAKYIETLPGGLVASAKESSGASFSFVDGKVKYVWVSLPVATTFKISYKVSIVPGTSGMQPIDGSFSYIENDETKRFALPASTVNIIGTGTSAPAEITNVAPPTTTEQPLVPNIKQPTTDTEQPAVTNVTPPATTKESPAVTNISTPTTTTEQPVVKKVVAESTATATASSKKANPEPKEPALSASTIPSPQGDVGYSVQIAALHNARTPEALAALYNIKQKVNTEMSDGFTKYVVGSHKVYKEAHDARDQIKIKGVSDAWVTAYNKGKRITVQEALMITSQKWYK